MIENEIPKLCINPQSRFSSCLYPYSPSSSSSRWLTATALSFVMVAAARNAPSSNGSSFAKASTAGQTTGNDRLRVAGRVSLRQRAKVRELWIEDSRRNELKKRESAHPPR